MAELHTATKQMQQHRLPKQKFGLYREATELTAMRIAPVYELITTLTPGEVKMLRHRSGSPKAAFIGLLNIMLSVQKNDEPFFKEQFAQQFKGIDYTETKSYLYKYILRHLTGAEPQPNTFAQINYSFATAEMLLVRGLISEALTIFKQANKLAQQEGFYQLSVVAIRRIKNVKLKTKRTQRDYEEIQELHEQEKFALKNDSDVSEAMMLYTNFIELIEKYGGPVNDKVLNQFEKIVKHPLIVNRATIYSPQARLIIFDLITNYYWLTQQTDLFTREYKAELVRYKPNLLKDPYYAYRNLFMLHNLSGSSAVIKTEAKKYTDLLAKAPTPDKKTTAYKQLFMLHARLRMPLKNDEQLKKLLADISSELKQPWLAGKDKERMNLLSQTLQVLIAQQKYTQAEMFLIPSLNDKAIEENLPAEFTGLRLLYLVVLFEQKRFAEMEPAIRAAKYALKTRGLESQVSTQLLAYFAALMRNAPAAKLKAIISQIQKQLVTIPYFKYQQLGVAYLVESAWFKQQ